MVPTGVPTGVRTGAPTAVPTGAPTAVPTGALTGVPTEVPTGALTGALTAVRTEALTGALRPEGFSSRMTTLPPGPRDGPDSSRVPAPSSGHPALCRSLRPAMGRLVATTFEEFANGYWGCAPLLSRAADLPRDFGDLFSADAVDELVATRGLRAPFLRMAKDGNTLADRSFTRGGGVGAGIQDQASDDAVLRNFAGGATLVLQGLHRTWEPLLAFSQGLTADLGHPNQVNAYVTPPQSTGFDDHYDVHDVFVLQIAGEKRWRIRPPVQAAPLRDQPWTDRRAEVEQAAAHPPALEETLHPGDCLYLPRGFLHSATALGATSIHLTIGVHPWTRAHVADALARSAARAATRDADLRASLPAGIDITSPTALAEHLSEVRDALRRALDEARPDELANAMAALHRDAQRPAPLRPLAQAVAAADLTPADPLVLRAHLAATLEPAAGSDGWVLRSRAGRLAVTAAELPALRSLLADGAADTADLGLDLARRLLLAGVVVVG